MADGLLDDVVQVIALRERERERETVCSGVQTVDACTARVTPGLQTNEEMGKQMR